jgi:hypothetical protein
MRSAEGLALIWNKTNRARVRATSSLNRPFQLLFRRCDHDGAWLPSRGVSTCRMLCIVHRRAREPLSETGTCRLVQGCWFAESCAGSMRYSGLHVAVSKAHAMRFDVQSQS